MFSRRSFFNINLIFPPRDTASNVNRLLCFHVLWCFSNGCLDVPLLDFLRKLWLLASHYYFISMTADMGVFMQSFSSLWVVFFLLILGVISSSHAKEMCSSATDGRCVLMVVWSCAVHTFICTDGTVRLHTNCPQRTSQTKEGHNFLCYVIFPYICNYITSAALIMGFK